MSYDFSTLDIDVISTTLQYQMPRIVDELYQSHPFLNMCKNGKFQESRESGSTIMTPVQVRNQSQFQTLASGWSQIDLVFQSALDTLQYNWASSLIPIGWSGQELRVNTGKAATAKLTVERAKMAYEQALRAVEERFTQGSAGVDVQPGVTQWNTLNGNTSLGSSGSTSGFLEATAPTTAFVQTNTIGGRSRTGIAGLNNQFADASTFSEIRSAMFQVDAEASKFRQGSATFDLVLASGTAYQLYMSQLADNERYVVGTSKRFDAVGIEGALLFKGAPVLATNFMDASGADINSMMLLDLAHIHPIWVEGGEFEMGKMQELQQYDGFAAKLLVHGQLWADRLSSSALITNVPA